MALATLKSVTQGGKCCKIKIFGFTFMEEADTIKKLKKNLSALVFAFWKKLALLVRGGSRFCQEPGRGKDKTMYIIAGLGNPTKEYDKTRHNAGFCAVDVLAERYGIDVSEKKHRALCGRGVIEGQKVLLVKPQTFMNLSGESLRAAADYYKITPQELIVIYDDISLDPGQLRIRTKGSAGGHNGIKNIIERLGTQEFMRIRIGVGAKPPKMELVDYVLSRFSKGEQELMDDAFREAAKAAVMLLTDGAQRTMNRFNAKKQNVNEPKPAGPMSRPENEPKPEAQMSQTGNGAEEVRKL